MICKLERHPASSIPRLLIQVCVFVAFGSLGRQQKSGPPVAGLPQTRAQALGVRPGGWCQGEHVLWGDVLGTKWLIVFWALEITGIEDVDRGFRPGSLTPSHLQ